MRHRKRGRKLGRNASHRKALFKNMAASLIRTVRPEEDAENAPYVEGRIVTTIHKAKELRPVVEKLVTLGKKARVHARNAEPFETRAEKNTAAYKEWRESDQWKQWAAARAPYVALRRRAFARLRDEEAVDILFDELAERFENRPGGYCRIVRLAGRRLGDAGERAIIEFVGKDDKRARAGRKRTAPVVRDDAPKVTADDAPAPAAETDTEPPTDAADPSGPPPEAPVTDVGVAAAGSPADEQPTNRPD